MSYVLIEIHGYRLLTNHRLTDIRRMTSVPHRPDANRALLSRDWLHMAFLHRPPALGNIYIPALNKHWHVFLVDSVCPAGSSPCRQPPLSRLPLWHYSPQSHLPLQNSQSSESSSRRSPSPLPTRAAMRPMVLSALESSTPVYSRRPSLSSSLLSTWPPAAQTGSSSSRCLS